jgi:hypothetical protein
MTDFSSVADFGISFGDHPEFPDASAQLNSLYATSIDDPAAFFVNPTSCTSVRPEQDLLMNLLCNVFITEVINPVHQGGSKWFKNCPITYKPHFNSYLPK